MISEKYQTVQQAIFTSFQTLCNFFIAYTFINICIQLPFTRVTYWNTCINIGIQLFFTQAIYWNNALLIYIPLTQALCWNIGMIHVLMYYWYPVTISMVTIALWRGCLIYNREVLNSILDFSATSNLRHFNICNDGFFGKRPTSEAQVVDLLGYATLKTEVPCHRRH